MGILTLMAYGSRHQRVKQSKAILTINTNEDTWHAWQFVEVQTSTDMVMVL
jgi:hypothetical protein